MTVWENEKLSFEFPVKIDMPPTLIYRNRFLINSRIYLRCVCQPSDEVENPKIWFILEESPFYSAILPRFEQLSDGTPGVISRSKMVVLIKNMFMNLESCKGLNCI